VPVHRQHPVQHLDPGALGWPSAANAHHRRGAVRCDANEPTVLDRPFAGRRHQEIHPASVALHDDRDALAGLPHQRPLHLLE
jgi:hypothetical protein